MADLLSVIQGCRPPVKRIAAALLSTTLLDLSAASAAADKAFFRSPPSDVAIHNPGSIEHQRNRTTISIRVPDNAGNALREVVLTPINAENPWDWGRRQPELYLGEYGLRRTEQSGSARARVSEQGHALTIQLDPPIQPGEQVNVLFRSINPPADIYLWTTSLVPAGANPIASHGPTLQQHIYRPGPFH